MPIRPSSAVNIGMTIVSALVIGVVGTFTYRLGAAYSIPYGLFASLLVAGILSFLAGVRGNIWHEFLHAAISTVVVWGLASQGTSTSALVVVGGSAFTTYWSVHAGYFWLYGIILVHVIVVFFPYKWLDAFRDTRDNSARTSTASHDNSELDKE